MGERCVEMTYGAVDRLVGGLPPSALRNRTWWANNSQVQARAWRAAGWHVDRVDMSAGKVWFAVGEVGGSYAARGFVPAKPKAGTAPTPSLEPCGHLDVAVRLEWLDAGAVTLDSTGRVQFPTLPGAPGVYRMTFNGRPDQERPRIYIGEAQSLARRARNYRNPGGRQQTSLRLNAALLEHLQAGGRVELAVALDVDITSDGVPQPLDLSRKSSRLLAESAALVLAQLAGDAELENLHG